MQSVYFCKNAGAALRLYVPEFSQFLMYFQHEIATIDLDSSYLRDPDTAREHAEKIVAESGLKASFIKPKGKTASTLPDLPVDFDFMTCPRIISDLSSKIGLGHIGPKVRAIINNASFPVLMPTPVFKPWQSITVFFGGSENAVKAMKLGLDLADKTGYPLKLFTQADGKKKDHYRQILEENGMLSLVGKMNAEWLFYDGGRLKSNLFDVPHDSLAVVGAYGHNVIKGMLFGSFMEEVQTVLPNNMMIVGPNV
jgi:hypothetical protein